MGKNDPETEEEYEAEYDIGVMVTGIVVIRAEPEIVCEEVVTKTTSQYLSLGPSSVNLQGVVVLPFGRKAALVLVSDGALSEVGERSVVLVD